MRRALILLALLALISTPALAALKLGDVGDGVSQLQQRLSDGGYYQGAVTGYFGPQTEAAVRLAQRSLGLTEDGVVGPQTLAALDPEQGGGGTSPAPNHHLVAPGETLTQIARLYGLSVEGLVAANGLASADKIYVGQRLQLGGAPTSPEPGRVAGITDLAVPVTLFLPKQRPVAPQAVAPSYPAVTQWLALTFNGGPDPETTPQLLDLLDTYGLKATFFLLGRQVEAYPELAREIVRRGHEVANQGYDGLELTRLSPSQITNQLERTRQAIEAATGVRPSYFRPAFGSQNKQVLQAAAQVGQQMVLWNNLGARSSLHLEAERWAEQLLEQSFAGAILLLPEGRQGLPAGLPLYLEGLRLRGFGSLTVAQLLGGGVVAQASSPRLP